jgi:hypothetical protein
MLVQSVKDRVVALEISTASSCGNAPVDTTALRSEIDNLTNELLNTRQGMADIRARLSSSEASIRDLPNIQTSMLLKCEEMVRRMVRERMESQLEEVVLNIRQHVDEQVATAVSALALQLGTQQHHVASFDTDDTISIAASESGVRGRRGRPKKPISPPSGLVVNLDML